MTEPALAAEDEELLRGLADANGVATGFWDWSGGYRMVPSRTLLRVLEALGVPVTEASGRHEIEAARRWTDDQPWRKVLPECTVVRAGQTAEVFVHVPHGRQVQLRYELEDGRTGELRQLDWYFEPREVDGEWVGRATFQVDASLPLGYHSMVAEVERPGQEPTTVTKPLYVVPVRLEPQLLAGEKRYWGVNVQAYSVRSRDSWGIGDAQDLSDLTSTCAAEGADFLLINPLHAAENISPVEDSPYLPVSRRWLNASYIRPETVVEYAQLNDAQKAEIDRDRVRALTSKPRRGGGLDRDGVWEAKLAALEVIHRQPRSMYREASFKRFQQEGGEDLRRFGLWCALAEHLGTTHFPEEYATAEMPAVEAIAPELESRIEFYSWCQWIAADQCRTPNAVGRDLGMPIGIMADLAVGVNRYGADFWAEPNHFAQDMAVGAPPDMYSQQGQDWSQPPWNPRALERAAYQPLREVLRSTMQLSGALRIDHILGLFRLWWIPQGEKADQGTYVYFDHEAMVGILLLEATRNESMVVGEDLGTVEPWVRQYLNERGVLGTSVLWFEKDEAGWPLHPEQYRQGVLATVNTHDLPPTAGYMEGIHTKLRSELGALVDPLEDVLEADRQEQDRMRRRLIDLGLLQPEGGAEDMIEAMHRYVCRTPARLVAAALVDAVGEKQPQNLPGTHHEYPNWRIPLSNPEGKPIWLEDLPNQKGLRRLFTVMREEM